MSVLPFDESCEVILEAAGDQFGQFRYAHARALNGNGHATIVLSFCLNMLRMKLYNSHDKKRLQKDDQWFPCPAVDIEDKLGMGRDRRRVAIKNLVKAGFIEVDNRAGNETWCRIDTGKIRDLGQKSGNRPSRSRETAPLEVGKPPLPYANNPPKNLPRETGRVATVPHAGFDDANLKRVDKLKRGLRSKKIPCRVSNSCRHKQAACFKSLEKDIGGPRLDAALNYFVENIDDPDLPVISGAKEFCNGCFNWIDKMARNAGELPEEDRNNLEEKWEETLPDGTKLRHTRIKR